jgi:hypothetical protein
MERGNPVASTDCLKVNGGQFFRAPRERNLRG